MADEPNLVVNSGSSSLKFGLYVANGDEETAIYTGAVDGIGSSNGAFRMQDANGKVILDKPHGAGSPSDALRHAITKCRALNIPDPAAIGHRIVHGGPSLRKHQRITPEVLSTLQKSVHFAPLHIPVSLALIRTAEELFPKLPQYACFDTAFHRTIPPVASHFALPKEMAREGIIRYGFHGLSYESLVRQLGKNIPSCIVAAHLGNGASLAALRDGVSIDTTMGLTPTGGVVMGTRSGDLDPGILLHLMRTRRLEADELEKLLNDSSGLAGISGGTSDMRDLEAAVSHGDSDAQLAIEMFAYSISKAVGAYAAALGGLDLLIFTGGIGEHSSALRNRVCSSLQSLGIQLDHDSNQKNLRRISTPQSACAVEILPSQENQQIAIHVRALNPE